MNHAMPRLLLLAPLALALAACGSDDAAPTPEASGEAPTPPATEDVTEAPPPRVAGPNEVLYLDPEEVGLATVTSGGDSYDVNPELGEVVLGIDGRDAAPEAVREWLGRFAPLDAAGTYDDLDPATLEQDYTALIVFTFSDGSARNLYLQEREDGVAALSQSDGPVWRLEPGVYDGLVPLADALSQ